MLVKEFRYDVFINHFKHPLGGEIYKVLDALGLKVFLNSEKFEFRDEEVEAAIRSAWLYIPIFSEGYAQSSRCLEELSSMHNRAKGTKIVPIFCRVKTDDVRYVKGGYKFDPNKVGGNSEKLEEWKKALYSVSHYIGPVVESKEDEDMLLKTITEWVEKEGKNCQELVALANTSSSTQPQGEEFAATTSNSGGSVMLVKKLKYDVFINHRGPDVKRTLAKDIYEMLTGMGLKVFLDSEELTWGGHFPSVLEEVMKSTWLNIVIFSEDYATSKWCLRELSFMCRREGSKIIPIFYHVFPAQIRYAKGSYGEAFGRHQDKDRHTPEKLLGWKAALHSASYYVGYIVYRREDEDMLLKKIADWVAKEGKDVQEFASANTGSSIRPQVESPLSFLTGGGYERPTRDVRYDVHINHRGPDVKLTLATAIYKRLKDMGLKVFLDAEELRLGDRASSVIEEAIRSAKFQIAIFSENFAESPWCLSEVALALQTGTRIVPIFYHLDPADVRYAIYDKGMYTKAFDRHVEEGKYASEKIWEWKEALRNASFYTGHIVYNKEDEDTLLDRLAYDAAEETRGLKGTIRGAEHPVSLDKAVQAFELSKLQNARSNQNLPIV